jgi:hypothetical protein
MFRNCQESISHIESSGGVILGIHKETDHAGLFGNECSSVNRLREIEGDLMAGYIIAVTEPVDKTT